MAQVREREEDRRPEAEGGNYFVVSTQEATWYISAAMARAVERELAASQVGWIVFVDLMGARVRVRARLIHYLAQCYAENRAAERRFWRCYKREARTERDWEDD